jgi:hypothetical protein
MSTSASLVDQAETRRVSFLLAAITNAESVVHSDNQRASVGLAVNALVFTGLVTLTTAFRSDWKAWPSWLHDWLGALGSLTLIAFVLSVVAFVRCVTPWAPKPSLLSLPKGAAVDEFFLRGRAHWLTGHVKLDLGYEELSVRITKLNVTEKLVGELMEVSAVRIRKGKFAKSGFYLLTGEIVLGVAYLLGIAAHSL